MGYIVVDSRQERLTFAMQQNATDDVALYWLNLVGMAQPQRLLSPSAFSTLYSTCASHGCVSHDEFHPSYSVNMDQVVFGYRMWDAVGNAVGNQALAIAVADGGTGKYTSIKSLTYNVTDIFSEDSCPRFAPGSQNQLVYFLRSYANSPNEVTISLLNTSTMVVRPIQTLPYVAIMSGCGDFIGGMVPGMPYMYMSLNATDPNPLPPPPHLSTAAADILPPGPAGNRSFTPNRWGYRGLRPVSVPFDTRPAYGSVTGRPSDGFMYTELFDVALVDTMGYEQTYQVSQCSGVAVGYPILACRTAHETIAMVDPGTGILVRNISIALNKSYINWCMTPVCFQAFVNL